MANTYTALTHAFVLDTSTNVAGLTALKGSASSAADTIVVTSPAVLDVDAPLACASITGAYTVATGVLTVTPATPSVTLTVGTDSYVTVDEANAYMAQRLYADAWTDASADDKVRALVSATRALENLTFKYRPTNMLQVLQFPRTIVRGPFFYDDWQFVQNTYDDTIVPQCVKDSECEEAFALLKYGDSERLRLQQQGVTSLTLGKLQEQYGATSSRQGLLSADALRMMQPWIAGAIRISRFR